MDNDLERLMKEREDILNSVSSLGFLRRGIISTNFRKCGKSNCACSKDGHPGHGPQYLWNTTIKGKSYARSLKPGPMMRKYEAETDNYRIFTKLVAEFVEVNEKICDLRPMAASEEKGEAEQLKKKSRRRSPKKQKEK